ncbi:MAG: LiaI-LiaF-like domain-containing protein [Patescibacteria group bacterium]
MSRRIGFGILLILVGLGLLFLLASGYSWDWARMWPLVLVLLGLLDLIEHGWRGLRGGGGFLILVGIFLLFFTLRVLPWSLRQAWPAGLILLGIVSLFGDGPSLPWAIVLVGGGGFLLALTTGNLPGGWRQFWPVVLILAGLAALVGRDDRSPRVARVPAADQAPFRHAQTAGGDERLAVLARIRAGEISVEEGEAILDGLKSRQTMRKSDSGHDE